MRLIYLTSPKKMRGAIPLPMIHFNLVADRIDYQGCDTLVFTSKQAVISAEAIDPAWKKYPAVAIGPATAKQIEALEGTVLHQPADFYGSELADDMIRLFRERKLLYLRPRKVSFDSRGHLAAAGIELKEQILYETDCRRYDETGKPPSHAIIVFTSPSTIHCFLENFSWDETYTAVVIGRATLEHLPEGCDYRIAEEPTIAACLDAAKLLQAENH